MSLWRSPLLQCIVWSFVVLVAIGSVRVTGETEAAEVAEVDVDDDVGRNVVEIVEARGYFVETHKVTTADNYVLTMYRLPKTYDESQSEAEPTANKPVVLLQHGLLDSSFTFVSNFRNQSLAFVLVDAGYDVWLANNRGTTWSREHLTYTDDDDEFWEFSWEDMGKYDLPAEIDYVLNEAQSSTLSFVGHSEGTSQAFVGFSIDQKLAQKNIRDNTFASYDYGCKCKRNSDIVKCPVSKCENKKVYGSFDPPAFPIGKMVYPRTGFYIGSADTIATTADIEKLREALPSGTIVHELAVQEYSHLDLTWAYNANEKVYQDLLAQLDKYQGVGYARETTATDSASRSTDNDLASAGTESEEITESRTSFSFRQLD
ncbi:hypothetical protein PRIC1_003675 [Phytophthora ramorum]|uniref:Gastric triacylglycerol lipase n=1 Tax=Phytophthora ramorum TaxID=164328 RepID=UPI0030A06AA8|nr:Gastric triacylglycerol lipase [Phytophthora ramorum]KAH7508240.1 Gastric triacylglycerol lipase [Phytophthora ramorum]